MSRIWLNGEPAEQIDIRDRGFQYGDGLFETMRLLGGKIPLLGQHLQRLSHGCQKLKLTTPDFTLLEQEICSFVQNENDAVVKLIYTRGNGQRGYTLPEPESPSRILMLNSVPSYPSSYRAEGVKLYTCKTKLGLNPVLAGIKHLNRLEQVLARSEWRIDDYQEGLLCDINENVIEGTVSNLFWVSEGQLFTADLTNSGVAGVMRETVIQLATENDISIKIGLWPQDELLAAEEIFITNSLIGIWPVRYILNRTFQVGPVTQQLQSLLQAKYAI